MTFNNILANDPALAELVMQNFRHVNYGNPLLPVNASGVSVDSTLDLGSSTRQWINGYFSIGVIFGVDTNLYRSAANTLKTDDSLIVATNLSILGVVNGATSFNNTITASKSDASTFDLINQNTHGTGLSRFIAQSNTNSTNAQMVADDANSMAKFGSTSGASNFLKIFTGSSGRFQLEIDSTELARFYTTGIDFSKNLGIGISAFSNTTLYANRTGSVDSNALYGRNILNGNNTIGIGVHGEATTTGTPDGQTIYAGYFDAYNGGGATNLTAYSLYSHRGNNYLNGNGGSTGIGVAPLSNLQLYVKRTDTISQVALRADLIQNGNSTTGKAGHFTATTTGSPDSNTIWAVYADAYSSGSPTNLTRYAFYSDRGNNYFNATDGDSYFARSIYVYGTALFQKSDASTYDTTLRNTHATGLARFIIQNNTTSTNFQMVVDDAGGRFYLGSSTGTNNFLYGYTGSSGYWKFTINGTEKMRVSTAGIVGTIATASQPNITSLGTLTGLNSAGGISAPMFAATQATTTAGTNYEGYYSYPNIATALTNYIHFSINRHLIVGGGSVTNLYLFDFPDSNVNHEVLDALLTTPNVDGWIRIRVNNALRWIPYYRDDG